MRARSVRRVLVVAAIATGGVLAAAIPGVGRSGQPSLQFQTEPPPDRVHVILGGPAISVESSAVTASPVKAGTATPGPARAWEAPSEPERPALNAPGLRLNTSRSPSGHSEAQEKAEANRERVRAKIEARRAG